MIWKPLDFETHLRPYRKVAFHTDSDGYIVWRYGTGGNIELLHLKVKRPRQGHGTALLKRMIQSLERNPPYHSVFGFCLPNNYAARAFYSKMGFSLTLVPHVYRFGTAVLFSAPYSKLKERHHANDQGS